MTYSPNFYAQKNTSLIKPQQAPDAPPLKPQVPQANPYNTFREQAAQRNQAQMRDQQNAMQRRFAQLGGGPSGAQIKMEQDMQRQGGEDLANQLGSINAQEAQANTQANQFQQQFGLEQTKALSGIDMARRQQALDEMGQNFNMLQAMYASPMNQGRQYRDLVEAGNFLSNRPGTNDFANYYSQIQGLANPMMRRLGVVPEGQSNG